MFTCELCMRPAKEIYRLLNGRLVCSMCVDGYRRNLIPAPPMLAAETMLAYMRDEGLPEYRFYLKGSDEYFVPNDNIHYLVVR